MAITEPFDDELIERAEEFARDISVLATRATTWADRVWQRRIARLLDDPASRSFLLALTDEVVRIPDRRRAAERLHDIVTGRPAPAVAGPIDRLLLRVGASLAPRFPRLVMPLTMVRLRRAFTGIVLPAEPAPFARHVRRRRSQGIRLNLNVLGEAVLGHDEALRREQSIREQLSFGHVDYVSVKISALCAQLDVAAFDHSVERIVARLEPLLTMAAQHQPPKFVNLDMEEFHDLELTVAAFTRSLSSASLEHVDAGIVLQAYLPDSHAALEALCAWARDRHRRAGGAIKVRLVKGANLAMEKVEAELRGWPQAPFRTKAEVDASYKRLLDIALRPENTGAVRVGVASHNLFDVGWALARREQLTEPRRIEIEMLEGMANPQAVATGQVAGGLLLYAPVVHRDDFASAVAYLVRRLDENTSPENFLRHLFTLMPGNAQWEIERQRFRAAVRDRHDLDTRSRRASVEHVAAPDEVRFVNEPDTDFAVKVARDAIVESLRAFARPRDGVPIVIGGQPIAAPATGSARDPSDPAEVRYEYVEATSAHVAAAVEVARHGASAWATRSGAERRKVLRAIATVMAAQREGTIATMAHDAGRTIREADAEVSEAIDFARYYGDSASDLDRVATTRGLRFAPYGVVVVASPWNFPYSIPAGGVLASLAAGNAVILKPAPESVLTAYVLAQQCWQAGVPPDALQFVATADDDVGRSLITHDGVDAVILTGSLETALMFLDWKPGLALHAETSGKNAMVITAAADIDDALRDLVRSAFGHAGQKCSAASLAIVEGPLYDSASFRARLADCVRTLRVGAAWDPATQVNPLIRPPSGSLERALSALDDGETWLVEPQQQGSRQLWTPGVKLGVRRGSFFHRTECFGPVLGVMRADDLDHAIALQNDVMFGLTGGICSLDPAEIERWLERVEVGNAYVNRGITGAMVGRQPFGGWKGSSIGPGAKAGGPNYVGSLGCWRAVAAADVATVAGAAAARWRELATGVDPTGLRAEQNLFRLRRLPATVVVRVAEGVDETDIAVANAVAAVAGVAVQWSSSDEDDDVFVVRMAHAAPSKVRLLGSHAPALLRALHRAGVLVDATPVVADGELELLRWTREQSVSRTLHRHGNVVARVE
ncbi:MAG TPA: bifunctional proline dehydrogenase/L-glutamate gamma-semialdehyde dehydrogenase [Acidimicrobiales bacterium]|nr:bifunctional proline dehydrogenase/L-glutamate gamma-semialdehyde dehydrogenase [Acidimicrobiales bacterium]